MLSASLNKTFPSFCAGHPGYGTEEGRLGAARRDQPGRGRDSRMSERSPRKYCRLGRPHRTRVGILENSTRPVVLTERGLVF